MKRSILTLLLAAAVLPRCATSPQREALTPVIATTPDARAFAGVWRGRVDSADDRLSGDLEFRFEPGGVVVLPSRSAPSRILWVRLTGSSVTGALAPYFDASKHADVYATFAGTLSDGVVHGVFLERVDMTWTEAATWSVERVAAR